MTLKTVDPLWFRAEKRTAFAPVVEVARRAARACGACGLLLAASAASAQQAGEVLWTVELQRSVIVSEPTVAPDGRIYAHAGAFHAIAPDGQLLWSQPLPDACASDVGPDGTVYAGSGNAVYAFSADGVLLWSFTEDPQGQGLMAGPTIGPDGNLYAITDGNGIGAFSLTPGGALRWNRTGFLNFDGTGLGRLQFAGDRFYFAEDIVPGCDADGLQQGVVAVTLNGDVDWCVPLSDVARPMAAPSGRAYVRFGNSALRAFEPDGSVAWTFGLPAPTNSVIGPAVGPDNAAYLSRNVDELWRVNADGSARWNVEDPDSSNFQKRASVAPDNSALVYGTGASFGVNGSIYARDPADGALLWTLGLPGQTAGAAAPAAFSADSRVVYVPTSTSTATRLLAIRVHDAPAPGDLDGDGDVDLTDLSLLLAAFGLCVGDPGFEPAADLNGSSCVELIDLSLLLANFGATP